MFKPIGILIKSSGARSKATDAIFALQVRQVARQVIDNNCGDLPQEVRDFIKIISFKNGVLTVGCTALVATELQLRSEGLKDDINRRFRKRIVGRLRFKVC